MEPGGASTTSEATNPSCAIMTRDLARRSGFGTHGDAITVYCNQIQAFFPDRKSIRRIYIYKITIDCDEDTRTVIRGNEVKVIDQMFNTYRSLLGSRRRFVYDGKGSIYTLYRLPNDYFTCTVVLSGTLLSRRSLLFEVKIEFDETITLRSLPTVMNVEMTKEMLEAIRALNIIIKQHAIMPEELISGNSKFDLDPWNTFDIDGGLIGLRHFKHTFRVTQMGLSLNINFSNVVHTKAVKVVKFLCAHQRVPTAEQIDWQQAEQTLKHLRIFDERFGLNRITGLSEDTCDTETVVVDRGMGPNGDEEIEITVLEYYTERLNINLTESADFPCICLGQGPYPILSPIECCTVASELYKRPLTRHQSASRLEHSRVTPERRRELVLGDLASRGYNASPFLESLGLKFFDNFAITKARVLPPPQLRVSNCPPFLPIDASWSFKDKHFLKPVEIKQWVVVSFFIHPAHPTIKTVVSNLMRLGEDHGMIIERPLAVLWEDVEVGGSASGLRVASMLNQLKKLGEVPQLVLCILPTRKNCSLYGPWKRMTLEIGMVTQCMAPNLGPSGSITDKYLTNLLLKINAKLGGTNTTLSGTSLNAIPTVTTIPTMIMGIKVCHGGPGELIPSAVAMVSSRRWPSISEYQACVRTQTPREELVHTIDCDVIREMLIGYRSTSLNVLPEQIIIFRGGISQSQFRQVLDVELEQIIQACKAYNKTWAPKFVLIVAQKESQVKFFDSKPKSLHATNVAPGTIVEGKPCHPLNNDFYLCAHDATIGTTRPTHYHVLYDEVGFAPDEIQQLVHSLSYDCQMSTTAISVVAPVHYAHLAATQMVRLMRCDNTSRASSSSAVCPQASMFFY